MESRRRGIVVTMLVLTASLGATRSAFAQACLGVGTHDMQGFMTARARFTEGAWSPGGTIGYDAPGPVSMYSSFEYWLYDNSDVEVARVLGNIVLEVPGLPVSVCPGFGGGYQWLANAGEFAGLGADGLLIGGGVAIGGRLETESGFAIIPHVAGVVVHDRASFRFGGYSATDSDTYGNFWLGFAIAAGSVYMGPQVSFFTEEGAEAIFSAELGVTF